MAGEPDAPPVRRAGTREWLATRRASGLFCAGLLAATLAPVLQNWTEAPEDGFPFSYYPMFSRPVGETYRVTHVLGFDRHGSERVIPYRYLGDGGMNEVRLRTQRAARHDPHGFCASVAERLRARPSPALREVQQLALVTGRYALAPFYEGRIEPRARREHARCRVAP